MEKKSLFGVKFMELKFKRKIFKSWDNRSTMIVIPRAIACVWGEYNSVILAFDGERLTITPTNESIPLHGDE
jgi:hypothetical protein